jgi:hypothetical protein
MKGRKKAVESIGCPSWILIELCAMPRIPVFGGFWRISGICVSAARTGHDAQTVLCSHWLGTALSEGKQVYPLKPQ